MKVSKGRLGFLRWAILIVTFVYFGTVLFALGIYEGDLVSSKTRTMQKAIEKAAVQCYALEGQYPPNLDYLVENYGIQIDYDNFIYEYFVFASNLKPVVKVIEKTSSR